MSHTRQSRPDSSLGFQVKVSEIFEGVASSLGSGMCTGRELNRACSPLSNKFEINNTVKARFCPWLEPFVRRTSLKPFKLFSSCLAAVLRRPQTRHQPTIVQGYLAHKKTASLGHYRRPMPRASWGSQGGWDFLMGEVPLYQAPRGRDPKDPQSIPA